jgi:hypothetical protein
MKKPFLLLSFFLLQIVNVHAQSQSCFWTENFDAPSFRDSCTTVFNGTHGFAQNSRIFVSAQHSDTAYIGVGDTIELRTDCFDLTGMTYAILSFSHICKIDFFDVAIVEISLDCGQNWYQLTSEYITNIVNPPGAPFAAQNYQFSAASYAAWQPANPLAVPTNTWWRTEYFDISGWAGFPDTRIRFIMWDANIPGGNGNNGWAIDNICIVAAPCELTPPTLSFIPPVYQNVIYNLGPYNITVATTDNSGIANVTLYYSVNGGPYIAVTMNNTQDSLYVGQIPAVNDGDTVCYYVVSTDGSPCGNQTTLPASGCMQFIASQGITFPYCDNFNVPPSLWTDSSLVGNWQLGVPSNGSLNNAYSPPNVWAVGLTAPYPPNANAQLYSPVFGPIPVGTKLSFWMNYNTEGFWDGTRLEYSTNGGATWSILGDIANSCQCQTNWYNGTVNCSGQPAWNGQSNGWVRAEYEFTSSFPFGPNIQFRFVFCSDAIIQNEGFMIDNFCIEVPQPFDAGVTAITAPLNFAMAGTCQNVVVNIKNFGLNPISNFDIYYSTNISGTVTTYGPFPFTGTLNPGQTQSVTLPCLLIPAGGFTLCAWTALAGDGNALNDTSCAPLVGLPVITIGSTSVCDNFEAGNQGWVSVVNSGGNPATTWQLGTPAFGATTGAYSGVNAWDVNLTTAYSPNANVSLYSPYYNFQGATNARLSFWINHNTQLNFDGVRLEYSLDAGASWNLMGLINPGPPYSNWYNSNVICSNLPGWSGNSGGWKKAEMNNLGSLGIPGNPNLIQFRFTFCSDAGTQLDGFSLDDFCIIIPQPLDAGISNIVQPGNYAPAGSCQPVVVTVTNFGLNPISNFDIYYSIDSAGVLTVYGPFPFTGTLNPGQSQQVSLPCVIFPAGQFTLCSWTALLNDGNTFNDTICSTLIGIPVISVGTSTFCDNFESGNIGWTVELLPGGDPGTTWQLGTPAFGATTGAYSGVNAWDINLTAPYTGNANVALRSPIFDFSATPQAGISFWINYNTEFSWDGTRLEYSLNGTTWILMGTAGAGPPYFNWYNGNMICSSTPGWNGNSQGWIKAEMKNLASLGLTGQNFVQFRFVFCSDAIIQLDGFSIDNFCIEVPQPFDAGVPTINAPVGFAPAGSCQPVTVTLQNFGLNPITSANLFYQVIAGGVPTTYGPFPWTGNLQPGASTQVTLPCVVFPSGGFSLCSWSVLTNDGNPYNDTTCAPLTGVPVISLTYTTSYCDNFESGNVGWASVLLPNGDPGTTWQLGTPSFGATTGAYSGVNAWDVNLTSGYTSNANVALYSPIFDITQATNCRLSFWRNHNTELSWDGVRLEYSLNNSGIWVTLGAVGSSLPYVNWYNGTTFCSNSLPAWAGNSGGWVKSEMQNLGLIPGFNTAQTIQFRFIFCSDAIINFDGFSIDDFCMEVPVPLTAAPVTIKDNTTFPLIFAGQPIQFSSDLKNKGTTPINYLEAQLWINGVQVANDVINYSPPLAPNATQLHNFSSYTWNAVAGSNQVCVVTSKPNQLTDLNPLDDTLCYQIQVIDTISALSTSICTDFEAGPEWVTLSALNYTSNTSWQWGTPAQTVLNSAYSGTKAWMTKLTTNYPNLDTSGLFTDLYTINPLNYYKISFRHKFSTEVFQDGGAIDYSTDYGNTWQLLGAFDPGNFWYNAPFVIALGGLPPDPGFSGALGTYMLSEYQKHYGLNATSVIFRFRFMSDYTVTGEGWVIDDFCFQDMGPTGILEPSLSVSGLALGQNIPNPASHLTLIPYYLPAQGNATLLVHDITGKQILAVDLEKQLSGLHSFELNTETLSPGMYFYTLTFNGERLTRRMVITR